MERRRYKQKHNKVRSGCSTCRKRHLKCDETRPVCLRCSKSGHKCEGYTDPSKVWIFEYSHETSTTGFKGSTTSGEVVIKTSTTSDRAPYVTPSTGSQDSDDENIADSILRRTPQTVSSFFIQPGSPFKTAVEQRAIKRFFEVIVPLLTRYMEQDVWGVAVPQNAWYNDAVRYSLIAATLVEEGMHTTVRQPPRSGKALSYVNQSIRALVDQKSSIVIILLTSLVLHFLETIARNADIAEMHLRSAVRIIAEYKQRLRNGDQVDREYADFIVGHVEPCILLGIEMHKSTMVKDNGSKRIDLHSTEAYEMRMKLTRPGVVDAFRSITDARNNLGTTALKLTQSVARCVTESSNKVTSQIAGPHDSKACRIQLSQPVYHDISGRFQHFWRLLKPMHDDTKFEARMLMVHFKVLKMILQDVKPDHASPPLSNQQAHEEEELSPNNNDDLLSSAISLAANPSVQQAENYKVELGLIPPLFYLATNNTVQCQPNLRRKAIRCLQYLFGERREGAWTAAQAGRIGAEIFNLQEDLKDQFVFDGGVSFEVLRHPSGSLGPELWMFYHATSTTSDKSGSAAPSTTRINQDGKSKVSSIPATTITECQIQMRLCINWTAEEIMKLPRGINELVRNAGYQGYFEDVLVEDDGGGVDFEMDD